MPLSGSGAVLGAAICLAGGILDPAGISKAGGLGSAIASWITSNAVINNTPPGGTMTAAAAVVTGFGRISFLVSGDDFGIAMANSIPASDPAALDKWKKLGNAIRTHIIDNGRVNPTAYVANPLGGAVTGAGTVTFTTPIFNPTLASELGLVDSANVLVWAALGSAILAHIAANAIANSLGFTSPTGGGTLVGASTIG